MIVAIRDHVKLRGDDPLDATIAGTQHKAYLVANLALNDGPQTAADHYRMELAAIHGAISFYYDNDPASARRGRATRRPLCASCLGWRSSERARRLLERATMPTSVSISI